MANKEQILSKIDLHELVNEHIETGVEGNNKFRAHWRGDKKASAQIYPPTNHPWPTWCDYGATVDHRGGNAANFLVAAGEANSYEEALDQLAARIGETYTRNGKKLTEEERRELNAKMEKERIAQTYLYLLCLEAHASLRKNKKVKEFVRKKWGINKKGIKWGALGFVTQKCLDRVKAQMKEMEPNKRRALEDVAYEMGLNQTAIGYRLMIPYGDDSSAKITGAKFRYIRNYNKKGTPTFGSKEWREYYLWHPDRHYYKQPEDNGFSKYWRIPDHTGLLDKDVIYGEMYLCPRPWPDSQVPFDRPLLLLEGEMDAITAFQRGYVALALGTVSASATQIKRIKKIAKKFPHVVIISDNDASDTGETGARKTAGNLHPDVDVRIVVPPREGSDKIDLAEYQLAGGSLDALVDQAEPYPQYLITQVPANTSHTELGKALGDATGAIAAVDAAAQACYVEVISKRFGLKKSVAEKLIKNAKTPKKRNRGMIRGAVYQGSGCVYAISRDGGREILAEWTIQCDRVVQVEDGDVLDTVIEAKSGRKVKIQIPHTKFVSAAKLRAHLTDADLAWTGSDAQTQRLLALAVDGVPRVRGTTILGRHNVDGAPVWVGPTSALTAECEAAIDADSAPIRYVDLGQAPQARDLRYTITDGWEDIARQALPLLPRVHTARVAYALLGWYFAAPLRPEILRLAHHSPHLDVVGSPGSGKTSLLAHIYQPMMGNLAGHPDLANCTPFALKTSLGSTNAIPWAFDEFKPTELPRDRIGAWAQAIKAAYDGSTLRQGTKDLSLRIYPMIAPVVRCGERRVSDHAQTERAITVTVPRDALEQSDKYRDIYHKLTALPLHHLAGPYLRWTLGLDIDKVWASAVRTYAEVRDDQYEINPRHHDNLTVMIFGLLMFKKFAKHCGANVKITKDTLRKLVTAQLRDALDGRHRPTDILDQYLTDLHYMATHDSPATKLLRGNVDYCVSLDEKTLYLAHRNCYAAWSAYRRSLGQDYDDGGERAIRHAAQENQKRGGYIRSENKQVRWVIDGDGKTKRVRSVEIDLHALCEAIDIDSWPQTVQSDYGDEDTFGGSRSRRGR